MAWKSHSRPPHQPDPTSLPPPPIGPKRVIRKRVRQAILRQAEIEWHLFPDLPGKHLYLRKSGRYSWECVNRTTGLVETRCDGSGFIRFPKSVSHRGKTYEWRRVGQRKFMQAARVRDLIDAGNKVASTP